MVTNGLSEGEEIASNGVFKIDAAAQLAGKPSMMNPDGNDTSTDHNHGSMNMDNNDDHKHQQVSGNFTNETFRVSGNCEICKSTIEKAAISLPGVHSANWNIESKMLHVSFNPKKSSLITIHKVIAQSGYDTEKETAPQEVYDNLLPCCQYTRTSDKGVQVYWYSHVLLPLNTTIRDEYTDMLYTVIIKRKKQYYTLVLLLRMDKNLMVRGLTIAKIQSEEKQPRKP